MIRNLLFDTHDTFLLKSLFKSFREFFNISKWVIEDLLSSIRVLNSSDEPEIPKWLISSTNQHQLIAEDGDEFIFNKYFVGSRSYNFFGKAFKNNQMRVLDELL